MNDEGVVEVLRGAREAVGKLIAMLEVEQGYHPVATVHLAKYQLLVSEIGDAIRYLESDIRADCCASCAACGDELMAGTYAYCKGCAEIL